MLYIAIQCCIVCCDGDMVVLMDAVEPPDPKEAVKWMYKSANSGFVRAQYQLALCLQHGRGIERDACEAV